MSHLLTAAALLAAAVGTGYCLVSSREGTDLPGAAAMAVMLVGMVDVMALGCQLLTANAWAVVLLVLAVGVLLTCRGSSLGVARALHLAAMGALTPAMAGMPSLAATHAHVAGQVAGSPLWSPATAVCLALSCGLAYTGYAAYAGRTAASHCRTALRLELFTGTVSAAAMTAMAAMG
ncbi:hypothetical protein ACFUN7_03220 [Streptomyces sp. NPDC057236]|uniref:hypothetical protein n=1 Tax=Streptomyces sp. NPDC057236 TaxID=3346059 RepID=UPI003640CDF7